MRGEWLPLVVAWASLLSCSTFVFVAGLQFPRDGVYDAAFFEQFRSAEGAYHGLVAVLKQLAQTLQLTGEQGKGELSVLDVGCGHGLLVEAWRAAGIEHSYCIEGAAEAMKMWPTALVDEFYVLKNLTDEDAASRVVQTDVITTFEVAEHLPPTHAAHFVSLLTTHNPQLIFFGAATTDQDQGRNPTHLNENTFEYWIGLFQQAGYVFDAVRTARARHLLLTTDAFRPWLATAWWYPKNILVFAPESQQPLLDVAVASHPAEADMLSEVYLGVADRTPIGDMWRRDWTEFGRLFYDEQRLARERLGKESMSEL